MKSIILLTLFMLVGCATSEQPKEQFYDLLHIDNNYVYKNPNIKDLNEKDFN